MKFPPVVFATSSRLLILFRAEIDFCCDSGSVNFTNRMRKLTY